MTVERIACSPRREVADIAEQMRVRADEKCLKFTLDVDPLVPEAILCDPTRLRQILVNLIGNAIKFTAVGEVRIVARLLVSGGETLNRLSFQIMDTGVGLTAAQIERLFVTFTQADTSTSRQYGGTGLGLAISKRLAEMLEGSLGVVSTPGIGSVFEFVLPVELPVPDQVRAMQGDGARLSAAECEQHVAAAGGQLGCRILLAEDAPDMQRLLTFVLRKAGAEVTLADNGRSAADMVLTAWRAKHPYDLILMDMQMPVLDGYNATKLLRRRGYPGAIVALTAHAMSGDRERCLAVGCDDYASKPINRTQLLRLVRKYDRGSGKCGSQN
jgi:CheY-like chemotaxis protein